MSSSLAVRGTLWALLGCAAIPAAPLRASGSDDVTAVSSKVFNGYKRTVLADGSFQPESYGFAIGGPLSRIPPGLLSPPLPTRDASVDDISFANVLRTIEGPLADQEYVPTAEPKNAGLLIVVFWGRSIGTNAFAGSEISRSGFGSDRDRVDAWNAGLLGFDAERVFDQGFDDPSNMMSNIRRQVHSSTLDAIEDDRYFVVLQAFDFQTAWRKRKAVLLWETRFSLTQRRHDFGQDLPGMAQAASQFFGQDSRGLVNRTIPEGRVDIGDVKSLGEIPERPGGGAGQSPARP